MIHLLNRVLNYVQRHIRPQDQDNPSQFSIVNLGGNYSGRLAQRATPVAMIETHKYKREKTRAPVEFVECVQCIESTYSAILLQSETYHYLAESAYLDSLLRYNTSSPVNQFGTDGGSTCAAWTKCQNIIRRVCCGYVD